MHLLCQIPAAFVKLRLRDGVLGQKQFQRLDLTAVQVFVRELSCGRGAFCACVPHTVHHFSRGERLLFSLTER